MKYWLINHSWESFVRTKEYCGFMAKDERDQIDVGDKVVYFGQGIVFGLFDAVAQVDNEFKGWKGNYPCQVKLAPVIISKTGLMARFLQSKFLMMKDEHQYRNLTELTEEEYNLIKMTIEPGKRELNIRFLSFAKNKFLKRVLLFIYNSK